MCRKDLLKWYGGIINLDIMERTNQISESRGKVNKLGMDRTAIEKTFNNKNRKTLELGKTTTEKTFNNINGKSLLWNPQGKI